MGLRFNLQHRRVKQMKTVASIFFAQPKFLHFYSFNSSFYEKNWRYVQIIVWYNNVCSSCIKWYYLWCECKLEGFAIAVESLNLWSLKIEWKFSFQSCNILDWSQADLCKEIYILLGDEECITCLNTLGWNTP